MRVIGEPVSVNTLAGTLGKSPQAIRQALDGSGVIKIDDSRPVLYALPDTMIGARRVPSKHDEIEYVVSTKAADAIVELWNSQRESIGGSLARMEIVSSMKPGAVAEQIGTLAGSLAALAFELDQVKSMPDWYEILTDKE
jgi:hypothetical protein